MLVHQVMTATPTTVGAGTGVKQALQLLDTAGVTSLPVVDGAGRIAGIVSEADLIRDLVAPDQRRSTRPIATSGDLPRRVEDVMTREVITVRAEDDLAVVVDTVTSTGVKSLPVVDDDRRCVGIVSRRDVVRMLATSDEEITHQLRALLAELAQQADLGAGDWTVSVEDGVVAVDGPATDKARSLAVAIARSVPGVVAAHTS